ncbi:MAG: hypothetical protein KDD66_13630 [Bdellovibrionales bacterium]|nr:hypothetical protein [Bdellovibrionales bacterium]
MRGLNFPTSRLRTPVTGERGSIVEGALTLSIFVVGAFTIYTRHWIPMQQATTQSIARSQASMSISPQGAMGKIVNLDLSINVGPQSLTALESDIVALRESLRRNNYPNLNRLCFHIVYINTDPNGDGTCDEFPEAVFWQPDFSEPDCRLEVWPVAKCKAKAEGVGRSCPGDAAASYEDWNTGEVGILKTFEVSL